MRLCTFPIKVFFLHRYSLKHLQNVSHIQQQRRRFSSNWTNFEFIPDKLLDEDLKEVFDMVVIGGGIVGITTARALLIEKPNLKVAVLEKESNVAMHQSSHNSGVIHAGIYYRPGSMKAKFCVSGMKLTYEFCDQNDIPYNKCGKLIVATNENEIYFLKKLFDNALKNGVPEVEMVGPEKIKEIEPHCRGLMAIHSPQTGITDWGIFTKRCAEDFQKRGGRVICNFEVAEIYETKEGSDFADVSSNPIVFSDVHHKKVVRAKYGISCGGLYSDKIAAMSSGLNEPVIIPFRGEYLELKEKKRHLIRGNIYPVPHSDLPFLGVHFTPRIDGRVLLGPNSVLAFGRESYNWKDINKKELWEMMKFIGFRRLIERHFSYGSREFMKSFIKSIQVKELQRYIPELTNDDVEYRGFSGVRAQAVDGMGDLIDELVLHLGSEGIEARILHVRNASSPAATASLALSEYLAKSANVEFEY